MEIKGLFPFLFVFEHLLMHSRQSTNDSDIALFQRLAGCLSPQTPICHCNLCNEVNYVVTTFNRITLKSYGFTLPRNAAILSLYASGYKFFQRRGKLRGVAKQDDVSAALPPKNYVYVNMDGDVLRSLRLLTIPTPPNTSLEKLEKLKEIERLLGEFVNNNPRENILE